MTYPIVVIDLVETALAGSWVYDNHKPQVKQFSCDEEHSDLVSIRIPTKWESGSEMARIITLMAESLPFIP